MKPLRWLGSASLFSLLACQNPAQLSQPIVGGILDDGHPYVVGVGFGDVLFCSGTLISKRTVITAAHCQGANKVFFGFDISAPSATVASSVQVTHPDFNSPGGVFFDHDLQLLFLEEDAPTQAVPLLRDTMDGSSTFIGPELSFVGYGLTSGASQDSGFKRVTQFPIQLIGPAGIDNGSVDAIDETQFYYAFPNKNTCNGDSGGPAFLIQNRVEVHAGVTSLGDVDCVLDGVDARTDLPAIQDFIQLQIDTIEGSDPCRNNGVCDETCNTGGEVKDPDCQVNHCDADGLCALACVSPRDPDCFEPGVNHCQNDGVCDPTCSTQDQDCVALCGAGDFCIRACPSPDQDCVAGSCGDGILNLGEECDDANQNDDDACTSSCTRQGCGDGVLEVGTEECDDANGQDNDGCSNRCKFERCGDRIVQNNGSGVSDHGAETCDDGNQNNDDTCTSICQPPQCGDGFLQIDQGELCDDGNRLASDGCSPDCGPELTGGACSVSINGVGLGSFFVYLASFLWLRARKRRG